MQSDERTCHQLGRGRIGIGDEMQDIWNERTTEELKKVTDTPDGSARAFADFFTILERDILGWNKDPALRRTGMLKCSEG